MSLDLKLDHNRSDRIDNTARRDIGNRLLVVHLVELTIKIAGKIAFLAAIVWTVNTVLHRIDTANDKQSTLTNTTQPCSPFRGR